MVELIIHKIKNITFLDRFCERPHNRWDTCARFCLKGLGSEGCKENRRHDHTESSFQRSECKDRLGSSPTLRLTLSVKKKKKLVETRGVIIELNVGVMMKSRLLCTYVNVLNSLVKTIYFCGPWLNIGCWMYAYKTRF